MIRQYRDEDCDDVLAAWEAASRVATPFLTEDFLRAEREAIRTLWLPKAETWVYDRSGTVVGFLALIGDEVGGFFVHPEYQGRGFGRALMEHAQRLRGELVVDVFKDNAAGCGFYDAYGFRAVSEHVHAETGRSQVRMHLPIQEG